MPPTPTLALAMPSCQFGHLSPNPLSKWSGLARPGLLSDLVSGGKKVRDIRYNIDGTPASVTVEGVWKAWEEAWSPEGIMGWGESPA